MNIFLTRKDISYKTCKEIHTFGNVACLQTVTGQQILDALALLTHDDGVPYMEYVAAIRNNPIATAVKLADLRHNSDLTRLDVVDQKALDRVEKYRRALELLEKSPRS